jgi:hypothetical protein
VLSEIAERGAGEWAGPFSHPVWAERLSFCNVERFANVYAGALPNTQAAFFGVTETSQGQTISIPVSPGHVKCSFIQ